MIIIRAQVPSPGAMVRLKIVTSNTTIYWRLLGLSTRPHFDRPIIGRGDHFFTLGMSDNRRDRPFVHWLWVLVKRLWLFGINKRSRLKRKNAYIEDVPRP